MKISASVGRSGRNHITDVKLVQKALNRSLKPPFALLKVDGFVGGKTISAIERFQRNFLGFKRPDALIETKGRTWQRYPP